MTHEATEPGGGRHTPVLVIRDYGEPVELVAAECQFAILDGPDGAPVAYVYRSEDAALYAAAPDLLKALRLFTSASMSSSNPHRGESSIGWQRGDGPTASERLKIALAAISAATGES